MGLKVYFSLFYSKSTSLCVTDQKRCGVKEADRMQGVMIKDCDLPKTLYSCIIGNVESTIFEQKYFF